MYKYFTLDVTYVVLLQVLAAPNTQQPRRGLSIHEYCAMNLLNENGVPTPSFKVAHTPAEAYDHALHYGTFF